MTGRPLRKVSMGNFSVLGVMLGYTHMPIELRRFGVNTFPPETGVAVHAALCELVAGGTIRPMIGRRIALAEVARHSTTTSTAVPPAAPSSTSRSGSTGLRNEPAAHDRSSPRAAASRDTSGPKMNRWNGATAYQYARPNRPRGGTARVARHVPPSSSRRDRPLEPGVARQAHLGAESQQSRRLDCLDSPEVDDITYPQRRSDDDVRAACRHRRPRRSSQPRTTHSEFPTSQPRSPPSAHISRNSGVGCRVGLDDLTVGEHGGARPLGIGRHRIGGRSAVHLGVGPAGGHVELTDSSQRELDCRHGTRSARAAQRRRSRGRAPRPR